LRFIAGRKEEGRRKKEEGRRKREEVVIRPGYKGFLDLQHCQA
jgi:hypothetical protein